MYHIINGQEGSSSYYSQIIILYKLVPPQLILYKLVPPQPPFYASIPGTPSGMKEIRMSINQWQLQPLQMIKILRCHSIDPPNFQNMQW